MSITCQVQGRPTGRLGGVTGDVPGRGLGAAAVLFFLFDERGHGLQPRHILAVIRDPQHRRGNVLALLQDASCVRRSARRPQPPAADGLLCAAGLCGQQLYKSLGGLLGVAVGAVRNL